MNTPIAQIVAITCFGNAYLQGNDVGRFFPDNSTCRFCDRVNFVTFKRRFLFSLKEKEVAGTPDEWFKFIKSAGASGVRLSCKPQNNLFIPDRMAAGLTGYGGTWRMEVVLPANRSESWEAQWLVWNRNAPDQRIWRVTYERNSAGTFKKGLQNDLQEAAGRLSQALHEIHAFAQKHDCGNFTKCFADALETLGSGGRALNGYHKDLAPAGFLSLPAEAILHACQLAWVFGGMGSWNDLWFGKDNQKEYERVSEKLFEVIKEAVSAAANTGCSV